MELDELKRTAIPPNPWFAQRIINNAALQERELPFLQAFWRDLNTEFPVPRPVLAMIMVMIFGFVFGVSVQPDSAAAGMFPESVLYETRGIL